MLPKKKITSFQKKSIVDPGPPKPLSFVGEVHIFFYIKNANFRIFSHERNALEKNRFLIKYSFEINLPT